MKKFHQTRDDSVNIIFNQYETEPYHPKQVTKLALLIFDQTKGILHNYGEQERYYLKYASLLHDIGYHISCDSHNKHAYKLIIQSNMKGFEDNELQIIANIARYHRGSLPKAKHDCFNKLKSTDEQQMVRILSSFIRIADGLDRSHTDAVQGIKFIPATESGKCILHIYSKPSGCYYELYGANKKKNLFEEIFDLPLEIRFYWEICG